MTGHAPSPIRRASICAATPEEIAATYDDEAAAAGPSREAREAWAVVVEPERSRE